MTLSSSSGASGLGLKSATASWSVGYSGFHNAVVSAFPPPPKASARLADQPTSLRQGYGASAEASAKAAGGPSAGPAICARPVAFRSRLPAVERNHVVMRPFVVVLEPAEHFLGGAEVERTNAAERSVALRWNS